MSSWRIGAVLTASLCLLPMARAAALTCHVSLRGVQLDDPDVLAQTAAILRPLIQVRQHVDEIQPLPPAIRELYQDVGTPRPEATAASLMLQLREDCAALPDDTVEAIVATRMKAAERDLDEAMRGEKERHTSERLEQQKQAQRDAEQQAKDKAVLDAKSKAPPLSAHILPTQEVVGAITCGQYLKYGSSFFPLDTEVGRAFTTVLQHVVDADPVASTANIHYANGRQYYGAAGYCFDHPNGTLSDAIHEYLLNARTWARPDRERQDAAADNAGASDTERRAIAERIRECWTRDAGALDLEKMSVVLNVRTRPGGIVQQVEIGREDLARLSDPRFRAFAERAVRAAMDPRCAVLPLPKEESARVDELTFRFTP